MLAKMFRESSTITVICLGYPQFYITIPETQIWSTCFAMNYKNRFSNILPLPISQTPIRPPFPLLPAPRPPRHPHPRGTLIHPHIIHHLPPQHRIPTAPPPKHGGRIAPEIAAVGRDTPGKCVFASPSSGIRGGGAPEGDGDKGVETEQLLPLREEAFSPRVLRGGLIVGVGARSWWCG